MDSNTIATPVRYDEKSHHIFEATGHSVCWLSRNTHHPHWSEGRPEGHAIAAAINAYPEIEELRKEVERLRGETQLALQRTLLRLSTMRKLTKKEYNFVAEPAKRALAGESA